MSIVLDAWNNGGANLDFDLPREDPVDLAAEKACKEESTRAKVANFKLIDMAMDMDESPRAKWLLVQSQREQWVRYCEECHARGVDS
ncbi:MAG: hypothetical protein WCK39_03090 [Methanomassiliicoccales archaeon]